MVVVRNVKTWIVGSLWMPQIKSLLSPFYINFTTHQRSVHAGFLLLLDPYLETETRLVGKVTCMPCHYGIHCHLSDRMITARPIRLCRGSSKYYSVSLPNTFKLNGVGSGSASKCLFWSRTIVSIVSIYRIITVLQVSLPTKEPGTFMHLGSVG